jgi:hypothetical protein
MLDRRSRTLHLLNRMLHLRRWVLNLLNRTLHLRGGSLLGRSRPELLLLDRSRMRRHRLDRALWLWLVWP